MDNNKIVKKRELEGILQVLWSGGDEFDTHYAQGIVAGVISGLIAVGMSQADAYPGGRQ